MIPVLNGLTSTSTAPWPSAARSSRCPASYRTGSRITQRLSCEAANGDTIDAELAGQGVPTDTLGISSIGETNTVTGGTANSPARPGPLSSID